MSANRQYLSLKKLTGRDIVRVAAKHNLREIQAEIGAGSHIDCTRIPMNQVLSGPATAAKVAAVAERLLHDAGAGKLRKDAVQAVELIASLPPDASVDQKVFFSDALAWARGFFNAPVLSAVVHLDESAPHCHILILPLVDGRMVGSALVGNRTRLQAMQADFFDQVGRVHGLIRAKARPRLRLAERQKAASMVLTAIQGDPGLLDVRDVEVALLELFKADPEPLLAALKLTVPVTPNPAKSFVEIMTKPCKPEKPIGFIKKPKGFDGDVPKHGETLSCVGFIPQSASLSGTDSGATAFSRCRDDAPAEYWDSERGEFRKPAAPKLSAVRDDAARELERSLAQLRQRRVRGG